MNFVYDGLPDHPAFSGNDLVVHFEMVCPMCLLSVTVFNIGPYLSLKTTHIVCSRAFVTAELLQLVVCSLQTAASSVSVAEPTR